jgi:PAS domain S-box-containing protein
VCDKAYRRFCREAKEFADGIRSVICGAQEEFSLESPCHSPDEKRWFLGRVTRFSGEGPIHVVVAHENITERKEAEDALKINDARLTEAQRVAHIGSWELDVKSHELFWSAETFRIFGYKPDQFSPTMETFFENVHPDDRLLMNEVTHAAFYERKPFDVDHRIILPDGKECYVHERAEVIFDDGGQPVRMTGTVQDITGRRHAEEEQKKLQEQLTQAQKMESVGRLAGGVAHDFNNILGIIIGYAEMIMMDMEPDNPIYPHLQRILNTTQRAADLVRQLLAFARKQTASPEILNINETVANMFRMLKRIIGEDINLIWKPGHDIWNVRIDPVQIDQILANLAVNSRDAISNTGSITLETGNVVFDYAYSAGHAEILPGEFVLLEVSDTGSGMSKEVVEHIFEPFFTTKETGKGTGLGLATVYGIVRQNNGFINVYSEEGKGTSFKIYLPRFKSDIVQSTVEKVSEKPQKGTETLLIAEDEKDYLMSCKIVLEKLGYTVFSAETPEQAITLSKEHPGDIDLLITDVIMPKMNGKELLEKIHKIRPGLKCLYMSGYTANVIAHHGVLDEGVNFLQKPFSVKTIAEKVREVIDSK